MTRHMSRTTFAALLALPALAVVLLAMLVMAPQAAALETRTGDEVTVADGETMEDLYVAANTVVVDGTVDGDLIVAARTVRINGTVDGDVMGGAETIVVTGEVTDDIRALAGSVVIEDGGTVAGDVLSGTYAVQVDPEATVGGDVTVGGYQLVIAGDVAGRVRGGLGALQISGSVGEDVDVAVAGPDEGRPDTAGFRSGVDSVDPGFVITDSARVGGDVAYRSTQEADIAAGADITGDVDYTQVEGSADRSAEAQAADLVSRGLSTFLTLLAVALLVLWLAPGHLNGAVAALKRRPWASLGWGALALPAVAVTLFVVVVATVLLGLLLGLVTIGGLVGLVVGAGSLTFLAVLVTAGTAAGLLAPLLVAMWAGGLVLRGRSESGYGSRVAVAAVGIGAYAVLRMIPVLGSLTALVVTLVGLGALVVYVWGRTRGRRAFPAAQPAPQPQPAPVTESVG